MSHRAAKQIRQDARHDDFRELSELFRKCAEDTRWFNEMYWEMNDKVMENTMRATGFQITTDNGVFRVDDPKFAVLSVWVTEAEEANGLRSAKINHHLDLEENKKLLEGLEWVCDVPRKPENENGTIYRMFFAHPGTFRFEPNHKRQDA